VSDEPADESAEDEWQGRVVPKSWSGEYEDFRPSCELRAAEDHLICALAGPIAEGRFRGRRNHVGASRDYEQFVDVLSGLTGLGAVGKAYGGYVEARAVELIDLHWYLVEALAELLIRQETLSGMLSTRACGLLWSAKHARTSPPAGGAGLPSSWGWTSGTVAGGSSFLTALPVWPDGCARLPRDSELGSQERD
jgi:hypothetical protein